MSSPTTLLLRGEVDLEVVGIVVDVEEAAALIKLTDASDRNGDLERILKISMTITMTQKQAITCALVPDAFYGHGSEVPLMDPFLQLK